jgi:hypothetical protein
MKRDKARVEGELWTEDHLKTYLDFNTYDGTDPDFHCLYRAYTRMNTAAFEQFVALFKAEGRNVEAKNLQGQTLSELASEHTQGKAYSEVLAG